LEVAAAVVVAIVTVTFGVFGLSVRFARVAAAIVFRPIGVTE